MITAEGIVAKIVSFIVNKTIGKLVDLPFDKRRKACRSLTRLYYCLQALDDVTETFRQTLDDFKNLGEAQAVVNALNNHAYEVELATNMFMDLGRELDAGLEIIDPALARCCHLLYLGKFDFLSFLSNSVEWDRTGPVAKIKVKRPLGKLEEVDLEELYSKAESALARGERIYWPRSALDDFAADFEEVSLSFEDDQTATELRELILEQNTRLKEAKERLRSLIKENFSIEEILFQSDSHPFR